MSATPEPESVTQTLTAVRKEGYSHNHQLFGLGITLTKSRVSPKSVTQAPLK